MSLKAKTKAIAATTGVSWLSVVISLFMLAFLFYIYASGSASVYYKLLFTAQPAAASTATTTPGISNGITQNPSSAGQSNSQLLMNDAADMYKGWGNLSNYFSH